MIFVNFKDIKMRRIVGNSLAHPGYETPILKFRDAVWESSLFTELFGELSKPSNVRMVGVIKNLGI